MEQTPPPAQAKIRRNRPMLFAVWLIPLAALLTGAWLFMQHIRDTGPEITLYIDDADGIYPEYTVIKVRSLEAGRISAMRLSDDGKGVILKAQLSAGVEDLVRSDSRFWVVRPHVGQGGINGLGTLFSGPYIAMLPGQSSEKADSFQVASLPPPSAFGEGGRWLRLEGGSGKMIEPGSPVTYRGITVGSVENAAFDAAADAVFYHIYITAPNEKLIGRNTRFWTQSGIRAELGGQGLKVDTPSFAALLSGSIAFDNGSGGRGEAVADETLFPLYPDQNAAENGEDGRSLYYVVFFRQSIRGLTAGSPVEYKGIPVGSVSDVPYFGRNDSLKLLETGHIPVRIRIDPARLELNADPQSSENWQQTIKAALQRGMNATLSSNNMLTGTLFVELHDPAPGQTLFRPRSDYRGDTVIASRNGAGLAQLQDQVSVLLDKINRLPLENTVTELNGSLAELRAALRESKNLLANPETQRLPENLNKTLIELQQTLKGISPESPVYRDVQQTLNSIDRTLREAAPVLNTLKEQPNALIFNRQATDPVPQGTR